MDFEEDSGTLKEDLRILLGSRFVAKKSKD